MKKTNKEKEMELERCPKFELGRAIDLAYTYHHGYVDKMGKPYIQHPLEVMNRVSHLGEKVMIVAILHDVLEDTLIPEEALYCQIKDEEIWEAIRAITRRNNEVYDEYIDRVLKNDIAAIVKYHDISHNLEKTEEVLRKFGSLQRRYKKAKDKMKNRMAQLDKEILVDGRKF